MKMPGYKPGAVQPLAKHDVRGILGAGLTVGRALADVGDSLGVIVQRQSRMEQRRNGIAAEGMMGEFAGKYGNKAYFTREELITINNEFNTGVQMPEGKDRIEAYLVGPALFEAHSRHVIDSLSKRISLPGPRADWVTQMSEVAAGQHTQRVAIAGAKQLKMEIAEGEAQYKLAMENDNFAMARELNSTNFNTTDAEKAIRAKDINSGEEYSRYAGAIDREDEQAIKDLITWYTDMDGNGVETYDGEFSAVQRHTAVTALRSKLASLISNRSAAQDAYFKWEKHRIGKDIKAIDTGYNLDPLRVKEVEKFFASNPSELVLKDQFAEAMLLAPYNATLGGLTQAQRKIKGAAEVGRLRKTGNAYQMLLADKLDKKLKQMSSFQAKDPVLYEATVGATNALNVINWGTDNMIGDLAKRRGIRTPAIHKGNSYKLLTADETIFLTNYLNERSDAEKLRMFASMTEALDTDAANIFDQIGHTQDNARWYIAGKTFASGQQGRSVAGEILKGFELMAETPVVIPKDWADSAWREIGIINMPNGKMKAAYVDSMLAVYVARNGNKINELSPNEDLVTSAHQAILGHTIHTPFTDSINPFKFSGDDQLEAPYGITNANYSDFFENLNAQYIKLSGTALKRDGSTYDASELLSDIKSGMLVLVNGGRGRAFVVRRNGGADEGLINKKTGSAFSIVYNDNMISAATDRSAPDLYEGMNKQTLNPITNLYEGIFN